MNDITIGDLVSERFSHVYDRGKSWYTSSWYTGIVVRLCRITGCISYMNYDGRVLTTFAEKMIRINDR